MLGGTAASCSREELENETDTGQRSRLTGLSSRRCSLRRVLDIELGNKMLLQLSHAIALIKGP